MSAFADKYLNAPAIRTLTADEVKPGMVVRTVKVYQTGAIEVRVFRTDLPDGAIADADRIELLEDVPDPREELAKRLYEARCTGLYALGWHQADPAVQNFWLAAAREAIAWHNEQVGQ